MRFDIFTLFPEMFRGPFDASIIKRARDAGIIEIHIYDIRDYAWGKRKQADDYPYGGGGGMVMKPGPVFRSVEAILGVPDVEEARTRGEVPPIILLTPQGRMLNQKVVEELAQHPRLLLICGRYEGFDERIRRYLATDEISIGDYVLSGGELAAMVIVDAVTRLLPGTLGHEHGAEEDSHATGLLEYPQYTRPPSFRGHRVPGAILSGDHESVDRLRRRQALLRTWLRRPDMLESAPLTEEDKTFLRSLGWKPRK